MLHVPPYDSYSEEERLGTRLCVQYLMHSMMLYRLAGSVMVENLQMRDGQEGIQAFIEKRKPEWSHSKDSIL